MTEHKNNSELINEVSGRLRKLSKYPLLVDHFVETIIFQDFLDNLNMYLTNHEELTEYIFKNNPD